MHALVVGLEIVGVQQGVEQREVLRQILRAEPQQRLASFADIRKADTAVFLQQHLVRHAGQVGNEGMQARLVFLQGQLRGAVFLPDARRTQVVLYGRRKAIQAALEDVIVRPAAHRVDDGLFAQVMGKEQEGQVDAAVLQQFERGQSAETGRVIAA